MTNPAAAAIRNCAADCSTIDWPMTSPATIQPTLPIIITRGNSRPGSTTWRRVSEFVSARLAM